MKLKHFTLIPIIAALVSCGGGDNNNDTLPTKQNTPSTQKTAPLSILVTDNLSAEYSEVWVTLFEVTAKNGSGEKIKLYENKQGNTFNLRQLFGIGSLLNLKNISLGEYSDIEVDVDNQITLIKSDGTTTVAGFSPDKLRVSLSLPGRINIDSTQASSLLIDFDLSQFTYDPSTNLVTAVVKQKDINQLEHIKAEIKGIVTKIDSTDSFRINLEEGKTELVVKLHKNGIVTKDDSTLNTMDTSLLQIGQKVKIRGNYDTQNQRVYARYVRVDSDNDTLSGKRSSVEGIVKFFDGSLLELDIKEADFMPAGDILQIANLSNAFFHRGSLSMLSAGQYVEIYGLWDGTTFTASKVSIEGALESNRNSSEFDDSYIEIEGRYTVNGSETSIMTTNVENTQLIVVGEKVFLDLSQAWFEHGSSSCLVDGAIIEVKGAIAQNIFMVNTIEIENGCALPFQSDSDRDDRDSDRDDRDSDRNDRNSDHDDRDSDRDDRDSDRDDRDSDRDDRDSDRDDRDSNSGSDHNE
ncbi:MAG: DUF4382 domain-containing protein [Gammaproteobacteria bacterium]|nr:DUF4382 domain-containing protein [Gammaproteobacteria bacterium]